jgi:HlyD family secretion protein
MTPDKLQSLRIPAESKVRSQKSVWLIFFLIAIATGVTLFFAWPREGDKVRLAGKKRSEPVVGKTDAPKKASTAVEATAGPSAATRVPPGKTEGSLLTVSGYIIARERIELSPRFMGTVTWIGVKKGDSVTNGQVVVLLDDAEYKARQHETAGRLAAARATLEKAKLQYERVKTLATDSIESKQSEDDMRLNVAAAASSVQEIEGSLQWINTYIDWCTIRSPINGVVLEKLVDPNELVTPQSFGGTRGPSTALIAVADLKDLQVEIDLNEADVAKVVLNQKCKISPEAYPDRVYDGYVAEKAPEASRQKGTLQIKVQIKNPDDFLTPELSAKVDFLPAEKR